MRLSLFLFTTSLELHWGLGARADSSCVSRTLSASSETGLTRFEGGSRKDMNYGQKSVGKISNDRFCGVWSIISKLEYNVKFLNETRITYKDDPIHP